jgi:hypothetical protein
MPRANASRATHGLINHLGGIDMVREQRRLSSIPYVRLQSMGWIHAKAGPTKSRLYLALASTPHKFWNATAAAATPTAVHAIDLFFCFRLPIKPPRAAGRARPNQSFSMPRVARAGAV